MINDKILYELEANFGNWWESGYSAPKMSKDLYPYTSMFSPIKVNKLTLKNRLVMGPMGNIDMAEETGRPNQKMISYFAERARGGVGLITTGLVPVSFNLDPTVKELGDLSYFPRIDRSRTVYVGWREVASNVHANGAHIFIQLTAGLGRVGNPQCLLTQTKLPVSASFNPNFYIPQIPSVRICGRKLKKMIKNFGQAAADAKACNIDGVYLHGHEGYLMEQMTNPAFNRRVLGRFSDWQRFGIDVVKQIRKRVGPDYPIMYRIDLSLALNATYQDRMNQKPFKKFRNERTIQQTLEYMVNLVRAGVDMFDVDLGCYDNWWLPHPPASMPSGCYLDIAKIAKDYFRANNILSNAGVAVPIVGVGKLGYPDLAEQALRDEKCDMIMLARPLLADPEWPNKAMSGDVHKIRPCIGCHEGCIKEFVDGGHPQCAVNPRTAFEEIFSREIPQVAEPQKIAVVGAGPAGIVSAKCLLERGHEVELLEANDHIGGTLIPGSVPAIKYEIKNYVEYLKNVVEDLERNTRFTLKLNKKVTIEDIKKGKYDAVVVATGSKICIPNIPGSDKKHVITVTEALSHPEIVQNAKEIVILGGGDSGCEAAYWASIELKKKVTIIEQRATLMTDSCTANRGHILHYLDKANVTTHNMSTLAEIKDNSVIINKNVHSSVPNPYNTWQPILPDNIHNPLAPKIGSKIQQQEIVADLVIVAIGTKSQNELYFELIKQNIVPQVYQVGDAFRPGKVFPAVKGAYRRCREI